MIQQGRYKLQPHLNIWYDVAEFNHLLAEATKLPDGSKARMANLEQVVELYKGPFMEEFYSEWIETQRRQLEDEYLKALSMLSNLYADQREYGRAITLLEEFITIDPYHDEVYCQLMEWHLAAGDKVSALRIYQRYLDTVAADGQLVPSSRISNLHKRILTGQKTA